MEVLGVSSAANRYQEKRDVVILYTDGNKLFDILEAQIWGISRSDECGVPSAAHKRGATQKDSEYGLPRRARGLLGCNIGNFGLHS